MSNYFKIDKLDIEYPIYLESNGKKWNFLAEYKKRLKSPKDNAHKLMEVLIKLGYFNFKIVPDVPFLVTDGIRVPGDKRSYYMVDYYIPDFNIVVVINNEFSNKLSPKLVNNMKSTLSNLGFEVLSLKLNADDSPENIAKVINGFNTSMKFRTPPSEIVKVRYFK